MKKRMIGIIGVLIALIASANLGSVSVALENEIITGEYPYYAFVEDAENPWGSVWEPLDATDSYEYSDDYFAVDSPGTHSALRTMSYALALAGFENQADGYPNESGVANPKMQKLLSELGFSNYQYWDEASEENGHSMGTSIAHKKITVETITGTESKELIVVAPRNYNYMTEWLSNFNVGTTGDHAGFNESAELVYGRLRQYIAEQGLSNYKIWMVGYSRGGAVIDLVAKKVNENLDSFSMRAEDLYAYTFGAPKASTTETKYNNIHDVKDGNDLLLGYVFPEQWGMYNTGTYEEIHPADLIIPETVINVEDLKDPARVMNLLVNNDGTVEEVGQIGGKDFMDGFLKFAVEAGMTRDYFDTTIKPALSKLMKVYQSRTLDKQGEVLDFITDQSNGMLGQLAGNLFIDLMSVPSDTLEAKLAEYPLYLDLVRVVDGEATDAEIAEIADYLERYVGTYDQYMEPKVTAAEFEEIKAALPDLVVALGPIIVADAKYTRDNYGENRSLYYLSTLVRNAEVLVIGHIPESIMPILKSLHDEDSPVTPKPSPENSNNESLPVIPKAPRTGVASAITTQ